jgi:hypothetical protein
MKRAIIALVLVLIVVGLILCLVEVNSHGVSSCCQAVLSIMLLLLTYWLLIKSNPQIPIVTSVTIGPLWKPPRTV